MVQYILLTPLGWVVIYPLDSFILPFEQLGQGVLMATGLLLGGNLD